MEDIIRVQKNSKLRPLLITIGILIYIVSFIVGIGFLTIKIILPELKPISVEEVKDSVVMINTYDENNELLGQGSGFCFKESDIIITNFHVLEGANKIEVITDEGANILANEVLVFDKVNDLALLEGDFKLKPVVHSSAFRLGEDDKITTISSPGGAFNTITEGNVSEVYSDAIEMIVSIKPGSSGGAVLNQKGRVVGVIVANIDQDKDVNLAVNIDVAVKLYDYYVDEKYAVIDDLDDIRSFHPDIFDDKDGNELVINDNWSKSKAMVYRPSSLEVFNNLTSSYSIFTRVMAENDDGFSRIYAAMNDKKKDMAVEYYQFLRSYDKWWFSDDNDEFDETANLMKENPKDWSDEQVIIDLGVLERYQLAILGARADGLIYYEDFAGVVDKLPIEEGRKSIILLTLGGNTPKYLSQKENKLVKEFVAKALEDDKDKIDAVLNRLGY